MEEIEISMEKGGGYGKTKTDDDNAIRRI